MEKNFPIWITNFKNYENCIGEKALALAKIHEEVAREIATEIAIAVSVLDIYRIKKEISLSVFSQHLDPVEFGACTGYTLPAAVKQAGATGTLLNHSERRLSSIVLSAAAGYAQEAGLWRIVCAENPQEVANIAKELKPEMIAYEPPELIGSSTLSVAIAHPKSIEESVRLANGIPLLVGAGINSTKDIEVSLNLGAKGFLVASSITKASDPKAKLLELVSVWASKK